MNSLSILSSRVDNIIGNTPPTTPSSDAFSDLRQQQQQLTTAERLLRSDGTTTSSSPLSSSASVGDFAAAEVDSAPARGTDEKENMQQKRSLLTKFYRGVLDSWINSFRWVTMAISIFLAWTASWFYDEGGKFSVIMPFFSLSVVILQALQIKKKSIPPPATPPKKRRTPPPVSLLPVRPNEPTSYTSGTSSAVITQPLHHHLRSKSAVDSTSDAVVPRRSIRIRLLNESSNLKSSKPASVKSPSSPSGLRLTKYPRNTGPPRPLLSKNPSQKTLILDLDETLIHSLAKGGRMTSGHMVEVKLDRQHAILYYVHKRPFCDEFLRKVYKWYNLVIFTASVQEYADPVIDWLEQDRKYFKGRYYRQHCTYRNGAYIKDLSSIEPDLSKVIILDNSPMSYMFHEDNAIPIEGWINDPTDIDLLNLIPLLQALHYVTDVRALLSLRMGESFSS